MPRAPQVSPIFLIALAVSILLGLIGGSSFHWAPGRGWSIYFAALLWTLISAAGTALGRVVQERLGRRRWPRGVALAALMFFPLTTAYLLVAALAMRGAATRPLPQLSVIAPLCYAVALVLSVILGLLYTLILPPGAAPRRPPEG